MNSNKLQGLHRLSEMGFPVPPFRVLPDFQSLTGGIASANDVVADWDALQRVVKSALAAIDGEAPHGFSLRSAASDEDTVQTSLAGRYLSFNGLRGLSDVCDAAVKIWRHHRSLAPPGGTCPLILQATHCCYFGGVLAMAARRSRPEVPRVSCSIEAFYGSCRTTVDGLAAPYRSQWVDGRWQHTFATEVTKSRFVAHADLFEGAAAGVNAGERLVPVAQPFPRQVRLYRASSGLELDVYGNRPPEPPGWYVTSLGERLVEIATVLETGDGVDMEWGCSPAGELSIYQVRPLTRPLPVLDAGSPGVTSDASGVLSGLPASPGRARGRVVAPGHPRGGEAHILFLGDTSGCDAASLAACAGVVTVFGGLLSHIAIACRELGIPCVVGIGAVLSANAEVEVDGDRGVVRLVGQPEASSRTRG